MLKNAQVFGGNKKSLFIKLEDTYCYAGHLLAPGHGFGLRSMAFYPSGKKRAFLCISFSFNKKLKNTKNPKNSKFFLCQKKHAILLVFLFEEISFWKYVSSQFNFKSKGGRYCDEGRRKLILDGFFQLCPAVNCFTFSDTYCCKTWLKTYFYKAWNSAILYLCVYKAKCVKRKPQEGSIPPFFFPWKRSSRWPFSTHLPSCAVAASGLFAARGRGTGAGRELGSNLSQWPSDGAW